MNQIKFHGVGGQGVVTAAKVLSIAASLYEDDYAITVPAYGHERRGAPVTTDIIIDKEPVLTNCYIYHPDMVVVCDPAAMENGIDVGKGIKENTVLVLNTDSEELAKAYMEKFGFKKAYYVDATAIAVETIGLNIPNGSILGAIAATGTVSLESVKKALNDFFGAKGGAKNGISAEQAFARIKEA